MTLTAGSSILPQVLTPIQNQSSGLCRVAALDNSQREALLPKSLCYHHLQRQCWQSQTRESGGSILRKPVGNGTPEEEAGNQWRGWKRAESATELLGYCWSKGKWLCDICRAQGGHYWLWGGKEEEPGTYWRYTDSSGFWWFKVTIFWLYDGAKVVCI